MGTQRHHQGHGDINGDVGTPSGTQRHHGRHRDISGDTTGDKGTTVGTWGHGDNIRDMGTLVGIYGHWDKNGDISGDMGIRGTAQQCFGTPWGQVTVRTVWGTTGAPWGIMGTLWGPLGHHGIPVIQWERFGVGYGDTGGHFGAHWVTVGTLWFNGDTSGQRRGHLGAL